MACCVIVGDHIVTEIVTEFSKNRLVKVNGFRSAILLAISHHINSIFKKKPDVIMLHVGMNDCKTLREILNDLHQFKIVISKALPHCKVIFSQSTVRVDNGKAILTLHDLSEQFSQLKLHVVDNSNIIVKHIG